MKSFPAGVFLVLAVMIILPIRPALAEKIDLAHPYAPGSRADEIAHHLRAATAEALKIVPIPRTARASELLELLRYGKIKLGVFSSTDIARIDEVSVFGLPYLVRSRDQVRAVISGLARKVFENAFREQGLELLAILDGPFHMVGTNHPGGSLFKLKGARIRPLNRSSSEFFSHLGMEVMSLPSSELYTGLQRGVLDAFEMTPETYNTMRLFEVSRFLLLTRHSYDPFWLVANRDWFNNLSKRDARTLSDAARRIEATSFADGRKLERQALSTARESGVEVIDLDPEELQWMTELSRRFYDDYATRSKTGADLLYEILKSP